MEQIENLNQQINVVQTKEVVSNQSVEPSKLEKRFAGSSPNDEKKAAKRRGRGRRRIKIEYIPEKSRRQITFSKRKGGLMKKAYELSTLTGTQILVLITSESGHVYTFATKHFQPIVQDPKGKNLIRTLLSAETPEMATETEIESTNISKMNVRNKFDDFKTALDTKQEQRVENPQYYYPQHQNSQMIQYPQGYPSQYPPQPMYVQSIPVERRLFPQTKVEEQAEQEQEQEPKVRIPEQNSLNQPNTKIETITAPIAVITTDHHQNLNQEKPKEKENIIDNTNREPQHQLSVSSAPNDLNEPQNHQDHTK